MGRYTPRVSLEPPGGVAAEVAGSLRLAGGAGKLARSIRSGLARLGFEGTLAFAPTAKAALWRAAGGGLALEQLPVEVLGLAADRLKLLRGLGIRDLGGLLQLPREGVARRFGQALVDGLDQALGRIPEPRRLYVPPARFEARLELPAAVIDAAAALFAIRRLLAGLEGFLAARHGGVRGFTLELFHARGAPTVIEIGLAAPARDAEHFARLLRERLERRPLAAPAEAVRLSAADLEPLAGRSGGLFSKDEAGGEDWLRLVERLQARFGQGAVHGLGLHAEHRPELAWKPIAPGQRLAAVEAPGPGARPLWLVEPPRALKGIEESGLELLAGPERIESGWWDGGEVRRDYFVARARDSLLWVYRDAGGWRLHGIFA